MKGIIVQNVGIGIGIIYKIKIMDAAAMKMQYLVRPSSQ